MNKHNGFYSYEVSRCRAMMILCQVPSTITEYLSLSIDTKVSPFPVRALSSAYLMATIFTLHIVALSLHYLCPFFSPHLQLLTCLILFCSFSTPICIPSPPLSHLGTFLALPVVSPSLLP